MKTLYFDCFAGASGNMILGGLISLGVDEARLRDDIKKLNVGPFGLEVNRVDRSGIGAVHVRTIYEEAKKHRHLPEIEEIIERSSLDPRVKKRSAAIFRRLAAAEAKVHGIEISKVHFHEVGAMDAIIDVVGACIGFESLGIEHFACSNIHVGSGFVDMDHGRYPVPPPAVAELLQNAPIYSTDLEGELITPTGAAIIAEVCSEFGPMPEMTLESSGYGAGTREYKRFPNALRLIVGEVKRTGLQISEDLILLETNLDDCTGEALGFVLEKALHLGALDCWFTPIQMKKNRPGVLVSVLCTPAFKEKLCELLYTETSTIGIRTATTKRECLVREIDSIETSYGLVEVKLAFFNGKIVNVKPEFDQLAEIAESTGVELKKIIQEVAGVCAKRYEGAAIVGKQAKSG